MTSQILKSNPRKVLKHVFFGIIILWLISFGISNDSTTSYAIAAILGFFMFFEVLLYQRTTLELTDEELKVKRTILFGMEWENYSVPLENIRASHYEVESYDYWVLIRYFFLEMLFPSGQNILTILKMDGKIHEIHFNANEQSVRDFMKKLPERLPIV